MKLQFFFFLSFLSLIFIHCKTGNFPTEKTTLPLTTDIDSPLQTATLDTFRYQLHWIDTFYIENTLINRVSLNDGFARDKLPINSFGHWIRRLPLKTGRPKVYLFNGEEKFNQDIHAFVFDLDVGEKDLQQCADAAIRIRAEYLYHMNKFDSIKFNYTNGISVPFSKWKDGYMPIPKGHKIIWAKNNKCNSSYESFKKYLIQVFNYAGTYSLNKELTSIPFKEMQIGDILIQGGFPGHTVVVVDMAYNPTTGKKQYLLAQSYMPAQEFHVLKNLESSDSPWYDLEYLTSNFLPVNTPEWSFTTDDLKRWN